MGAEGDDGAGSSGLGGLRSGASGVNEGGGVESVLRVVHCAESQIAAISRRLFVPVDCHKGPWHVGFSHEDGAVMVVYFEQEITVSDLAGQSPGKARGLIGRDHDERYEPAIALGLAEFMLDHPFHVAGLRNSHKRFTPDVSARGPFP